MSRIRRIGTIDIGSNAVRLSISNVVGYDGTSKLIEDSYYRVPVRLGQDTFENGNISEETEQRLIDALKAFYLLMKVNRVEQHRAIATSAMRNALNGAEIVERAKKESQIDIEIISGKEEASIIHHLNLSGFVPSNNTAMLVDVGGGSTEISFLKENAKIASASFPIGTVRLLLDKVDEEEWVKMKDWVKEIVSTHDNITTLGFGGNIKHVAKLLADQNDPERKVSRVDFEVLYDKLLAQSYNERIINYNMKPDRADVIVPASKIFISVMQAANSEEIKVPKKGLLIGAARSML